jgi:triphosphoribosyl-dephospho-CoA synthase
MAALLAFNTDAATDAGSIGRLGTLRLADIAVAALIDEATLTPKPGLVDLRGGGVHRDMDWMLMCDSARALHPTFHALAEAGRRIADPLTLRVRIGQIGRSGEAAMLQATGGVNTHRGAIWALGLLVTAAAMSDADAAVDAIASRAGAIARCRDAFAPRRSGNKGEAACRRYGVGGARAQAQAGFPHVIGLGLPRLRASRRNGDDELSARLNCLMALVAELDDTCVLSRGGSEALAAVQEGAARVLAAGGAGSAAGRSALRRLEQALVALQLSPGGAADLLAATLFLDRLAQAGRNHSQG